MNTCTCTIIDTLFNETTYEMSIT